MSRRRVSGFVLAAHGRGHRVPNARTDDRDAVRLVGRAGSHGAGLARGAAVGEWPLAALGWGPLYEPHRYPDGAEVGRRLPLPAGRYRLSLIGEPLGAAEPAVAVVPDRPAAPYRLFPTRPAAGGWEADFEVRPGERAIGLRLRGGGAMLLKAELSIQPLAEGPV